MVGNWGEETLRQRLRPSPFSQSCAHIFVCLLLTRHSYYRRGWNESLVSSSALYCLMKLELLRHLVNNALRYWYCPIFTQQDSHSISFVVFSLALFVCCPGLKGYPPNRWPTMGESTFLEFPYITWRTALQTKRRWAPPSSTLTTGSRRVAPEIKHWKHELILLRWGDVGQLPFCLLTRGNDSQESSSKNPESIQWLEFGIQVSLRESRIQYLESRSHSVESKIQDCLALTWGETTQRNNFRNN